MPRDKILTPYPNTMYKDRFTREAEKRLTDQAIANAQQAVVAAEVVVTQVADVDASSIALQRETNPDYAAKLDAEAGAINTAEHEMEETIAVDEGDNAPQVEESDD